MGQRETAERAQPTPTARVLGAAFRREPIREHPGTPRAGPIVVVAHTDEVVPPDGHGQSLLTPAERARADGFRHEEDRRDFVAAHVLARIVGGQLLDGPAGDVRITQRCGACGGPHGRPAVPGRLDIHLSMAHTQGVVAAAAGRSPVGVDIERIGLRHVGFALYRHVLAAAEMAAVARAPDPHRAFLRLWVRKEALVKIDVTTLDRLGDVDLAHLPLEEPIFGARTSPLGSFWPGLHVCDWVDERRGIVGAAVGNRPARFSFLS